jgi:hypothetical protein
MSINRQGREGKCKVGGRRERDVHEPRRPRIQLERCSKVRYEHRVAPPRAIHRVEDGEDRQKGDKASKDWSVVWELEAVLPRECENNTEEYGGEGGGDELYAGTLAEAPTASGNRRNLQAGKGCLLTTPEGPLGGRRLALLFLGLPLCSVLCW